ncbi:MAG: ABC transporter permease [Rhodococcus sp.]|nr:ABC transporter permease [Rhodococcus sp. (in: high G+C Gram-positive bacteria)]
MAVLQAERIKITTTRSPWWCTATIIVLGLGIAALMGFGSKFSVDNYEKEIAAGNTPQYELVLPVVSDVLIGVAGLGVMVLMIMAALTVTSEYRFGVIRTTFQAIPNRSAVIVAKAFLVGVFGAVLTGALAFGAFAVGKLMAGSEAGAALTLSGEENWRAVYSVPIYALLCVFLAVAVGALLRQSAGAIALLLLWPLLVESIVGLFGSFGRNVQPFLPFTNADQFLGIARGVDYHWGPWVSLAYFAGFVAIIFALALLVVNKRDA